MQLVAWIGLCLFITISNTYAQAHRTLPKGVRLFAYRNVNTTPIDATYNQAQAVSPLSYDINANAETLSGLGDIAEFYFEQIRAVSPAAYDQLTFGKFNLSAEAQVLVHGFGGGYGISNRLTVYGILPYYDARVNMKYRQDQGSNAQQVADQVQQESGNDISGVIANITDTIPAATGNLLQSVVTNTFGYKEVGTWQGKGYGDFELGAMYLLLDRPTWGVAVTGGIVAPTGRQDDPDILQDIAFGDGQWDVFVESAIGLMPSDKWWFGHTLRYTYQAPTDKTLRIPSDPDFPLSDQKGRFNVKFGDRIDTIFTVTRLFNDWLSLSPSYEMNYQMSSRYDSVYRDANGYLAQNSDRLAHILRLSGAMSSVQPYMKKLFPLPAVITINVQQTIGGRNVPKIGRYEIEFRMYF
jgi:hypothetical protein